jgi:TRAP-type C4-dicarboxylate transport system substrate-binding protein
VKNVAFFLMTVVLVVSFALVCAAPAPAAQKTFHWRFQKAYKGFCDVAGNSFKEYVKERTGGRLAIEVLEPNSVVPVMEMLNAIRARVLDAGWTYGPFYTGTVGPIADLEAGLPGVWPLAGEAHDAYYNRGLLEVVRKEYRKHNVFWSPSYMGTMYPKVRATGPYAKLAFELGMKPVTMPGGELYSALKLGTVDGWIQASTSLKTYSLWEVTKTLFITPSLTTVVGAWHVNLDRWNELPEDIQRVCLDWFKYGSLLVAEDNWAQAQIDLRISKEKYGVKLKTWSDEEWATITGVARKMAEEYRAKGGVAAEAVDIIVKQQRDYGRW